MCGIHVVVSTTSSGYQSAQLKRRLWNRGPDHFQQIDTHLEVPEAPGRSITVSLTSTVLSLRGQRITTQPFRDLSSKSAFCWNGEAWKIGGELATETGNDAQVIWRLLTDKEGSDGRVEAVLDIFRSVEGPFAFVYFDNLVKRLYFGRDRLGRRSLLINQDNGVIELSSVAESTTTAWREVEADGIYALDLSQLHQDHNSNARGASIKRYDWAPSATGDFVSSIGVFNMSLPMETLRLTAASASIHQLRHQLTESLKLRVLHVPIPPPKGAADNSRIAILFSGGLDCTVLARLSDDLVPKDQGIDLINVAFENPRIASCRQADGTNSAMDIYEECPDRITGRSSFQELLDVCPQRSWRFIAVNVPYQETLAHRQEVVSLIHPHNTEMDLSIAYALYFAARGRGRSHTHLEVLPEDFTASARVLLSGLGADELFGGYVRHATAFSRKGYAGLLDELRLDVSRLGKRNLGRDDRVMAHWSREVRFPYLDEQLVKWAIGIPVWEKCDFHNQGDDARPEPGKRILRLLAKELGMSSVAQERKRAIQFGSRTAKMESGRIKGTTLIAS